MPSRNVRMWVADLEEIRAGTALSWSPNLEAQLRAAFEEASGQPRITRAEACDAVAICGFPALFWLDFGYRYMEANRVYWTIQRLHNIPVWVATQGSIYFVDRTLHVPVADQRILGEEWATGTVRNTFAAPGLRLHEWVEERRELVWHVAVSGLQHLFDSDTEGEDYGYDPWEFDTWSSAGCSTQVDSRSEFGEAWEAEMGESQVDEGFQQDQWEVESVPASLVGPKERVARIRLWDDPSIDGDELAEYERRIEQFWEEQEMREFDEMDGRMFDEMSAPYEISVEGEARQLVIEEDMWSCESITHDYEADGLHFVPCGFGGSALNDMVHYLTSNHVVETVSDEASNTTTIVEHWTLKRTALGLLAFWLTIFGALGFFVSQVLPPGMVPCCLAGPTIRLEQMVGARENFFGAIHSPFQTRGTQPEDLLCAFAPSNVSEHCVNTFLVARTGERFGASAEDQTDYVHRKVDPRTKEKRCECKPWQATKDYVRGILDWFVEAVEFLGKALSAFFGAASTALLTKGATLCWALALFAWWKQGALQVEVVREQLGEDVLAELHRRMRVYLHGAEAWRDERGARDDRRGDEGFSDSGAES
ncbi:unnamed protein product [Symbiodinium sp. CCMP2592]|nr:unnamed protein product [Symbiodinium sp. CCMP2592]